MSWIDSVLWFGLGRRIVLSNDEVIRCDWRCLTDIFRAWIKRTAIYHVGYFSQEHSPLFFCERLILAGAVQALPDRFDQ